MHEPEPAPSHASERPWIFGFLIAPAAIVSNGVIQGGVLAFLLTQQHVDIGRSSKIVSFLALPTMLYFLWSPITDFFVRRRTWLLISTLGAAGFMAAGLFQPSLASNRAIALILLSACCAQLAVSSCGGMMGAMVREESKRIAGSVYQAGSLGFGAASVWALLRVSEHGSLAVLAVIVAAIILLPGLFAIAAPKQPQVASGDLRETAHQLWDEFKVTFFRWDAIPYLCCMLFPMASGAAVGLLPAVAQNYGVSGQQIGWMNGLGGAILTAAGCLAATLVPARVRASVSYLSAGCINAVTLCVLWLGPLRPWTYFVGITLYLFTVGTAYALFTAVVLEFLGDSGKSGSGRYSIINSLGNVPVLYMLVIDGWGASRFGPRGLAGTEAVVGGIGGVLLLGYFLLSKRNETPAEERAEIAPAT